MNGKHGLFLFLGVIAISAFAPACETADLIYDGGIDTAVDTSLPDAPIDSVPDIAPEIPQPDVPADTPPPDLAADLPPDIPVPDMEEEEADEPLPPPECPGGPYGTRVGDRIADLTFPTSDGTNVSFCDYFRDVTRELLLVFYTAGW